MIIVFIFHDIISFCFGTAEYTELMKMKLIPFLVLGFLDLLVIRMSVYGEDFVNATMSLT